MYSAETFLSLCFKKHHKQCFQSKRRVCKAPSPIRQGVPSEPPGHVCPRDPSVFSHSPLCSAVYCHFLVWTQLQRVALAATCQVRHRPGTWAGCMRVEQRTVTHSRSCSVRVVQGFPAAALWALGGDDSLARGPSCAHIPLGPDPVTHPLRHPTSYDNQHVPGCCQCARGAKSP